jgi:selenocysteine-specific elongation factor
MILGTAGHVDHGKTALVRALTGIDTDRLPDEKRRGITIDLGFAPLRLEGAPAVSIVDVPGHEAFVRNMLAGATGIDLALLVIAADEGVMPQTREHLLILTLLGVSSGVVALTKADLVDEEWLALVRDDVAALVRGTPFEGAPVIATSSTTGAGLDDVRAAITAAVRARPERDAADLFRMPVDRVFTVRGTGTVVTGTVWSGTLARDATVRLLPADRVARVRGIQSHGDAVAAVGPGMRAAVALAGLEVADVERGAVLVTWPAWRASARWMAEVALDPAAGISLGPRTAVRVHLGTADVGARIVAAAGALEPGGRSVARVVLEEPAVARAGDRFVLRAPSPMRTIGGGVVLDPLPVHRRSRPAAASRTPGERLRAMAREAGRAGLAPDEVPVRLGVSPDDAGGVIDGAGVLRAGARLVDDSVLAAAIAEAASLLAAHHVEHPLETGMPVQELRARLGGSADIIEVVLMRAAAEGRMQIENAVAATAGWEPALSPELRGAGERILAALRGAGREPPSVEDLAAAHSAHAFSILKFFERSGRVVQVAADRFYDAEALAGMIAALRKGMADGREYPPQELRDMIGVSRKYLIPFLEYCDRTGVTERRADGRVLAGAVRATSRQVLA